MLTHEQTQLKVKSVMNVKMCYTSVEGWQ